MYFNHAIVEPKFYLKVALSSLKCELSDEQLTPSPIQNIFVIFIGPEL